MHLHYHAEVVHGHGRGDAGIVLAATVPLDGATADRTHVVPEAAVPFGFVHLDHLVLDIDGAGGHHTAVVVHAAPPVDSRLVADANVTPQGIKGLRFVNFYNYAVLLHCDVGLNAIVILESQTEVDISHKSLL